jgi:hypothetical protein
MRPIRLSCSALMAYVKNLDHSGESGLDGASG